MDYQTYFFKSLYSQALMNFPAKIIAGERLNVDYVNKRGRITGLMVVQDHVDEIFREENVPSLLSQLTQVIVGCIHQLLIQIDEIEISKMNPEYVESRFHELLSNHAVPILRGEKEPDGCFDLNEVRQYALVNKLNKFNQ